MSIIGKFIEDRKQISAHQELRGGRREKTANGTGFPFRVGKMLQNQIMFMAAQIYEHAKNP